MAKTAIWVRGFDFGTAADAIETHCAAVGEVVSVELKGNKDEKRSNAALVTFASEETAQKAAEELDKSTIEGNTRYIEVALRGAEQDSKKASGKGQGKGQGKGMTDFANAAWEMGMMMGMKGGTAGKGKDAMKAMVQKMFSQNGGRSSKLKQHNLDNSKTWKSKLWEAYGKTYKGEGFTKDTIVFTTGEAVGGVYTTTVSCDKFSTTHDGEGDSQKASANAAAEVALRAEFPELANEFEQEGGSWGGKSEQGGLAARWMGGGGGGQQKQQQQQQSLPARSQLQNAYCKKHKKIAKGDVSYSTEQDPTDEKKFTSTVSSETFATSYTGAPAVGKKAAEENAAILAMEAEFPEEYASSSTGSWISQKNKQGTQAEGGGKRKRGGKDRTDEQKRGGRGGPKGQLNSALRKITKEPVDAGMIEYCTTEEQEMTITTVVIKCLDPEQSFTGEPVDGTTPKSKREAEDSAATIAYEALKDHMDVAEAEQEIEQEAKRQKKEEEGIAAEGLV